MQVAIEYMYGHAVILRWTTALLALVDLLDQQVTLGVCIFHVPAVLIATSEVISATLSLPHQIFCPLILWAARRLHEDVQRSNGVIEKLPAMLFRNICLDALGIQSSGASSGGYSAMVGLDAVESYHSRLNHPAPTPSLRKSFIDCRTSFARMVKTFAAARVVSRQASEIILIANDDFIAAARHLFTAAQQGILDGYIQEFVPNFESFSDFGFLDTVHIDYNADSTFVWAKRGMIFNSQLANHAPMWRWRGDAHPNLPNTPPHVRRIPTPAPPVPSATRDLTAGTSIRRRTSDSIALAALSLTMAWLQKDVGEMANNATAYMWIHTAILRWMQALLTLTETIDPELIASGTYGETFGHFDVRRLCGAASEVISCTLCLPNGAFSPTILWIARRLCEDAMRTNGVIERRTLAAVKGACHAAMGMASNDRDGYAQLISQQSANRHTQNGWHLTPLPWPTLRRSFINCPASFANSYGELQRLHSSCATIANERTLLPSSFRCAWEALQRATLQGRVDDYVHDFIVHFNGFRKFSHDRLLTTICHLEATAGDLCE
jgi:hypothetical protein